MTSGDDLGAPYPPELALLDPQRSGWGNLGLWHETSTYPEAAAALATQVGRGAELGPDDRVAELGCGRGASLALWRRAFGVGDVVGYELDPTAAAAAAQHGRTHHAPAEAVRGERALDAIVSVDAAYHFDHERLFEACGAALRPGGRFAWTDLLRRSDLGALGRGAVHAAARLFGLGRAAPLDASGLAARLEQAGLELISHRDLTEPVLGGFARHVQTLGDAGRLRGPGARKLLITAAGCRAVLRGDAVRYVELVARRRPA